MEVNETLTEVEDINNIAKEISGNMSGGLKVAAGVGIGVIAGIIFYKFVAEPVIAKIKNYRKNDDNDGIVIIDEDDESGEG